MHSESETLVQDMHEQVIN